MGEWHQVRIGDFLHRVKQPVQLLDNADYKLVTVRMHHNGVVLRESKKGKLIGSNMYRVKPGQFILSGIDARHGAFGVVPEELDGAIVTNDFWYFDVDETVVSRDFFLWLTTTPLFLDACIKSSEGTTNRRRLQGDKFFNFSFLFPEIEEQKRLAKKFNAIDATFATMRDGLEKQFEYLKQIRQAILQEAVEGKLTAEWRRQHPVIKGNPQYDAVALLAQIKAEKDRLVKEGKIRKEKTLQPITDDDKSFNLPDGWVWCRLPQLLAFQDALRRGPFGSSITKDMFVPQSDTTTKVYEQKNAIYKNWSIGNYYIDLHNNSHLNNFLAYPGDIIISCAGTIGETYLLPNDAPIGVINQALLKVRLNNNAVDSYYFLKTFSALTKSRINSDAKGTAMKNIGSVDYLKNELIFPLPPLAEQKVAVTRVDSLMATIDELEKQVAERKKQAQLLMQTVLREAFDGN